MAEKLSTTLANQVANNLYDTFDGGTLKLYTGSQPASADDAPTGTLLVTITLPSPAFAAASGGAKAKSGAWSATGAAAGNAGWCRFENSATGKKLDGAVTATGGGGELELDNVSIAIGQTVTINTGTATQPLS